MREAILLALAVLTCYRLTQFIVYDEGPWRIGDRIRDRAGGYDRKPDGQARTALGRMVNCPYCVGVYAALLCAGLLAATYIPGPVGYVGLALLAIGGIAGGQAFLESISARKY